MYHVDDRVVSKDGRRGRIMYVLRDYIGVIWEAKQDTMNDPKIYGHQMEELPIKTDYVRLEK